MAVHLKGLVEGVLRKKAATLAERNDSYERVKAYPRADDDDIFS